MTPSQAAHRAGWFYWLGYWFSTDLEAILHNEHPTHWSGTARDLCLAYGIDHREAAA